MKKDPIYVNQYCITKSLPVIQAYENHANTAKKVFKKYFPDSPFTVADCKKMFLQGGEYILNELVTNAASQRRDFKEKFPLVKVESDLPQLQDIENQLGSFRSVLPRYIGEAASPYIYAELDLLDFPPDDSPVVFSERGRALLKEHFTYPNEAKYRRIIEISENIQKDIKDCKEWLQEHKREVPQDLGKLIGSFVWKNGDGYHTNPMLFHF